MLPALSIDSHSQPEGNTGTTPMVFNVSLSYPSSQTVKVNYYTQDVSARAGIDYVATSGTLTFNPGVTSQTISVGVIGNTVVEADKVFNVYLGTPTNAAIATSPGAGTIKNDDGLPGDIYSFSFSGMSSPQFVNESIPVTITAKDYFGNVASNFTSQVNLTGFANGIDISNTIAGNVPVSANFNGNYNIGFRFTPSTNIVVTHVRSLAGQKVSLWTDSGTLVFSQPVSGIDGVWTDTQLSNPVQLSAGTSYRLVMYQANGKIYYGSLPSTFANGTINSGCYVSGDGFPVNLDSGTIYLVDLRYKLGSSIDSPISPTVSGNFV